MKQTNIVILVTILILTAAAGGVSMADTFGTGANQFTIDFVNISNATNPTSGYGIVSKDYRIGKYEITNNQWNKFKAAYGTVTGNPSAAYARGSYFTGTNVPTNDVSWYEAAQFINWLNTSTGHQAAYKFTGTKGTSTYTFKVWQAGDTGFNADNPFRNSNAFYFLPTENEWVKAAYWNGLALQTYTTKAGESLYQGNGSNGGWNYHDGDNGPNGPAEGPWNVGSGSQELNGTYDMMGNVWEWMESPHTTGDYWVGSERGLRGGAYDNFDGDGGLASSYRGGYHPDNENPAVGFRVVSIIPEPTSLVLLGLGGLALRYRKQ